MRSAGDEVGWHAAPAPRASERSIPRAGAGAYAHLRAYAPIKHWRVEAEGGIRVALATIEKSLVHDLHGVQHAVTKAL